MMFLFQFWFWFWILRSLGEFIENRVNFFLICKSQLGHQWNKDWVEFSD